MGDQIDQCRVRLVMRLALEIGCEQRRIMTSTPSSCAAKAAQNPAAPAPTTTSGTLASNPSFGGVRMLTENQAQLFDMRRADMPAGGARCGYGWRCRITGSVLSGTRVQVLGSPSSKRHVWPRAETRTSSPRSTRQETGLKRTTNGSQPGLTLS